MHLCLVTAPSLLSRFVIFINLVFSG